GGNATQTWTTVTGGGLNFAAAVSFDSLFGTFTLAGSGNYRFQQGLKAINGAAVSSITLSTTGTTVFNGVNSSTAGSSMGPMTVVQGTLAGTGSLNSLTTIN